LSEPNSSLLRKVADAIAPPVPAPRHEPVDHVRAAVESFVAQKALIEKQGEEIANLRVAVGRLDVELETHVHLLNEAMRERDHYMAYSYTLTTQLDCVQKLIIDALDLAKREQIRPPKPQTPPLVFEPEAPIDEPPILNGDASGSEDRGQV
jgi:hypothetical protein